MEPAGQGHDRLNPRRNDPSREINERVKMKKRLSLWEWAAKRCDELYCSANSGPDDDMIQKFINQHGDEYLRLVK